MLRKLLTFHSDHCPVLAIKRRVCARRKGG